MSSNRSLAEVPRRSPQKSCLRDFSRSESVLPAMRRSPTTLSLSDDDDSSYNMRKVFFDEVEIREYKQILGDNPAVTEGVPLGLDWDYQTQYRINLEMYEFTRASVRRKSRKKLMISSKRRLRILVEAGYSLEEIGEAIMSVQKIKAERIKSVQAFGWNGPLDFLSGAVEQMGAALRSGKRRSSKILLGGGMMAAIQKIKLNREPRRRSYGNPVA